jgi:hypothetical protein
MLKKTIGVTLFLLAAIFASLESLSLYSIFSGSPVRFSYSTTTEGIIKVHNIIFTSEPERNIIAHIAVISATALLVALGSKLLRR